MKWDLTAERNENVHAAERRLVGKAYSMDSVRQIEDFVDDSINHFLRRLGGLTGKELNLGEWFQLYAIGKSALPSSLQSPASLLLKFDLC